MGRPRKGNRNSDPLFPSKSANERRQRQRGSRQVGTGFRFEFKKNLRRKLRGSGEKVYRRGPKSGHKSFHRNSDANSEPRKKPVGFVAKNRSEFPTTAPKGEGHRNSDTPLPRKQNNAGCKAIMAAVGVKSPVAKLRKARIRDLRQPYRHRDAHVRREPGMGRLPVQCRLAASLLDETLQLVILPALGLVFAVDNLLAGQPGFIRPVLASLANTALACHRH